MPHYVASDLGLHCLLMALLLVLPKNRLRYTGTHSGATTVTSFASLLNGTQFLQVVVVLLFYVHGKHLRSCQDGQLT